jgi:hypothetical protein
MDAWQFCSSHHRGEFPLETIFQALGSIHYTLNFPFKEKCMKKLFTFVVTMLLGATLAFGQSTGGDKDKGGPEKTTKAASGKKATKTKKGHKGGKKGKKSSSTTTTPPPK